MLVLVRVRENCQPLARFDVGAAHKAAHRFAKEELIVQFLGQPIAAINLGAGSRGEMVESSFRFTHP